MPKRAKPASDVGYKKPPRNTQFRCGQSGNPKGRPTGSKNFARVIQEELKARIPVTENGMRKTITKEQAAIKQLVNKAAAGDPRALTILLKAAELDNNELIAKSGPEVLSAAEDELVMADIVRRIRLMDDPAIEIRPIESPNALPGPEPADN